MHSDELVALAESCSAVRSSIGTMLLAPSGSHEREVARVRFRKSLRKLLREAREEEVGLFLEVASELAG